MQIYDSPESDLKLNDVFEFIGVLTLDSELQADKDHDELSNGFCEDALVHLPPNKVFDPLQLQNFYWVFIVYVVGTYLYSKSELHCASAI